MDQRHTLAQCRIKHEFVVCNFDLPLGSVFEPKLHATCATVN